MGIAHHRVGDVVGGEAERVDGQEGLSGLELGRLGILEADNVQVVAVDLEVDPDSLFR